MCVCAHIIYIYIHVLCVFLNFYATCMCLCIYISICVCNFLLTWKTLKPMVKSQFFTFPQKDPRFHQLRPPGPWEGHSGHFWGSPAQILKLGSLSLGICTKTGKIRQYLDRIPRIGTPIWSKPFLFGPFGSRPQPRSNPSRFFRGSNHLTMIIHWLGWSSK